MKSEKVTEARSRWYDDACGTAHALELVGERWSLLVVRELLMGPRRFGELRSSLPGISANVLTQRLGALEGAGVLTRERLPSPANAQVYALTPWGYESEAVVQALGRWAARSPDHDVTLPLSPVSAMMSLRTMFDAAGAGDMAATIGLRFGPDSFLARVAGGALSIVRGEGAADATVVTDPMTLASVVYGGRPIAGAEADGVMTVSGDRDVFARFVTLFVLPPKAG